MTYQEWFKENQKYIDGVDVDAWCETAFTAGRKAGLLEAAKVCDDPHEPAEIIRNLAGEKE